MCLGIPARVVSVGLRHPDLADVDIGGVPQVVNVGLLDRPVAAGEWVLVHMGFALAAVTAHQADEALRVFRDERGAEGAR
jgi:hydrogenase assembly chaperone HypC/HupF